MPTDPKNFSDGFSDGLTPVKSMDVAASSNVGDLLQQYAQTSFGGRRLGEAADTLELMIRDPDCFVVATLSGAMTVAKMGLVLVEMIERGWIQAIISTGALMAHGFVEDSGRTHFKYDPRMDDVELFNKGYDRVYDTLELEQNLDDIETIVRQVVDGIAEDTVLCSHLLMRELGSYLTKTCAKESRAILKSCYEQQVPVYVPAFTDSELGLDVEVLNQMRLKEGKKRRSFDPFLDLENYARHMAVQKKTGIFTIGGGVPRNWAQQLGPLLDLMTKRSGGDGDRFRFHYGVRICPEPVHWGGLSGCTYSEGVSWGKFVPVSEGGRFSEVLCDATIAWPLLVRGMIDRLGQTVIRKSFPPPHNDGPIQL
jgi:deoxyhypusine synthase